MARTGHKKGGGKNFLPGHDPRRNLQGRPKVEIKTHDIKGELKARFIDNINKYGHLPQHQVKEMIEDPDLPLIDKTCLRLWIALSNDADAARLGWLSRTVGLEEARKIDANITTLEVLIAGSMEEDDE